MYIYIYIIQLSDRTRLSISLSLSLSEYIYIYIYIYIYTHIGKSPLIIVFFLLKYLKLAGFRMPPMNEKTFILDFIMLSCPFLLMRKHFTDDLFISLSTYLWLYVLCLCINVYIYIYIYIYVCVCVCGCIYIYIYILCIDHQDILIARHFLTFFRHPPL